jgi:hypothetical protein
MSAAAGSFAALAPAERLLVWGFRRWAAGFAHDCCRQWGLVWREFRRELGADDGKRALVAFAALFKQLMLHGRRTIHYHQPCCPCLGADEAWLVALVAACQHGRSARARDLAEAMVAAEGAGDLLEAGSALAARLSARSLFLPYREGVPDAASRPQVRTLH